MLPFKIGLSELGFDDGELSLKDANEEVPAPASRHQEEGNDALRLVLHEVEHRFDHPRRSGHLPMVGDAFF